MEDVSAVRADDLPVDNFGSGHTGHVVGLLQHQHALAGVGQLPRPGGPEQASTDDKIVVSHDAISPFVHSPRCPASGIFSRTLQSMMSTSLNVSLDDRTAFS